jgi:N-acetylglucosaminyldiphosphoundecaprenol N-acetyl-beta-D-mannosaminyltransferase
MDRPILLGVRVDPLTIQDLNALIAEVVRRGERWIIANHNLHSIYLYHRDSKMRAFYRKTKAVHVDGMALVWVGKLLGYPFQSHHRVTYVDWTGPLMAEALQQGWRIFYLGSKPSVAERGAEVLRQSFSGLQIKTHHGYFDARPGSRENRLVIERIAAFAPQILMVGMGMPRQEHWILDNLSEVSANVILPSGAAIDYVAGVVPTPPRWMGRVGLEWLSRLVSERGRLWRRYLIEPWFLLGPLARDVWVCRVLRKPLRAYDN